MVRNTAVWGLVAAAAALVASSSALAQQGSQSFQFLEAVKKRKGDEVTKMLSQPGTVLVNSRQTGDGEGALHIVTRGRDLTWLEFLMSKGARADVQNRDGDSPLILASQLGWTDGAEALLRRGANVDLANSRGETALIFAVQKRDIAMVRLLIGRGANPNRTDSVAGYSALDYARQDSRAAAIARLLEEAGKKPARQVAGPKL